MTKITKSDPSDFAMIQVLPFCNNPKDLDPSYKMDLDLWECLGRKKKLHLITKEVRYIRLCLSMDTIICALLGL